MRHLRAFSPILAALAVVAVSLSGCASREKPEPKITYKERPVELLYNIAAQYLENGDHQRSILYFREVERQHPYSEWARRAIIMEAYGAYLARNYDDAVADAERFAQLYPGNPTTSYAYYLKAISYFEQIVDVGRDQGHTEQARLALNEVIRRYPNTPYATDAELKLDMVDDQLAGKEMTVGRFYLLEGDTVAAIGRFRSVIERYSTTSHTPEALYRLVECYLTLGITVEAQRNAAVLGSNFPGSVWYADAYALMTDKGQKLEVMPSDEPRRLRNLFGFRRSAPPAATPGDALKPPA